MQIFSRKGYIIKASKHLCNKSIYGEVTKELLTDLSKEIKSAVNYMLYNTEI